jgi:ELWxxDGT repeat protein
MQTRFQKIFFGAAASMLTALSAQAQTSAPPVLLDIATGVHHSDPSDFVALGGKTIFAAQDLTHGRELWITDGTAAGTKMLIDLVPGATGCDPQFLVRMGTRVAFVATEPIYGREVWVTDGTAAGTQVLANIAAGSRSSKPEDLVVAQGRLFFWADDQVHGRELYSSDGSAAGTKMVKDILPGYLGSEPRMMTAWGSRLAFSADDGVHGRELWVSDGTEAGTQMVADLKTGSSSGDPHELTDFGDLLVFRSFHYGVGIELIATDGTANGTFVVHDSLPGSSSGGPRYLRVHRGKLYYVANGNRDAYVWDGTTVTKLLTESFPYDAEGSFYPIGEKLVFTAGLNRDLWITDGTVAGTQPVFSASSTAPRPTRMRVLAPFGHGRLMLGASETSHGNDLWITDGTEQGTVPMDIRDRADSSWPHIELDARLPGHVIIVSYHPDTGWEPRIYSEGADAMSHGEGYAIGGTAPSLWSEDPVLGGTVQWGGHVERGIAAVLAIGRQGNLALTYRATLYVDLFASPVFVPFGVVNNDWSAGMPLPNDKNFKGFQLAMQAIVPGTSSPLGFDLSPAIFWTLR